MNPPRIVGIAGYGKVGKALGKLFVAKVWDPPQGMKDEVALEGDLLFICVPSPSKTDGSCDTSIVEEVIAKSKAKINVIRSTVSVGFTEDMANKYLKRIVFMPEVGPSEFPNHPYNDLSNVSFAILGGIKEDTGEVAAFWQGILYNVKIFQTDSKTAELLKLTENAYFYSKLTFLNSIYDICQKQGINYDELRLMLTEDFRIESDHSFIFPGKRRIGGKCLPKDLANLTTLAKKSGSDSQLFELMEKLNNERN